MAKDKETIAALLRFIKVYSGLTLHADEYFNGIKTRKGKKYFNVELQQRISESIEFQQLERLSSNSGIITRVDPNGFRRVAIFFDADTLKRWAAHADNAGGIYEGHNLRC